MPTLKPQSNGPLYNNTVIGIYSDRRRVGYYIWYSPSVNGQCTNFILFDVTL